MFYSNCYIMHILLLIFLGLKASAEEKDYFGHRVIRQAPASTISQPYSTPDSAEFIPKDYSALRVPLTENNTPIYVDFNIFILGIWNVEESLELISMSLKLNMFWQDLRLKNESDSRHHQILRPDILDRIWHPDIYIRNVKSIDHVELFSKTASLIVSPNGDLKYSARLTATVSCPMDFYHYPADTQYCNVDLLSYSFERNKLLLGWQKNMVGMNDEVRLSNFQIKLDTISKLLVQTESGVVSSGIRFTIKLKRRLSYHLLQTYMPSTLFVLVSWLSFILPYESTSERMGYSMTCLFTLTAMFSSVRQSTPTVCYIKALDIWMFACLFFVFLTLLQHAFLSRMSRSSKLNKYVSTKNRMKNGDNNAKNTKKSNGAVIEETSFSRNTSGNSAEISTISSKVQSNAVTINEPKQLRIFQRIIKKTDKYLSYLIPFLFFNFNIIYWSWLATVYYYSE